MDSKEHVAMAVTLTAAQLVAALRLSDSPEELAEATRLLAYATEAVTKYAPDAPDVTHNEAARRLAGYAYDQPEAGRGDAYANAGRNSGAWAVLLPYRIHRAGYSDAEAVAQAQEAVGSVGNPVTGVDVTGTTLTVTFADGTTETHDLPAVSGVDNAAVQALIDAHAAMANIHHRPSSRVGVVNLLGARLPASDGVTMRIGWSNTQDYSEDVFTRDGNHPDDGAAGGTIAGVFPPVQPAGIPDIPDVAVNEKYLHIWIGEIPGNVVQLTFFGAPAHGVSEAAAQRYNTTDGTWWVSNLPISAGISAYAFSAIVAGLLIATQQWVTAQIANIMLSGGGITTAQAQTLIDAAIGAFQTAAEVQAVVTAAIAALPDYQTLQEVNALITAAVDALSLGQTAIQVQALIDAHAAMSNVHHAPGGGGSPKWHWLSQVTGAFAADTARDMATVATFPLGPYADYAALQAAVADGSMTQVAVRLSQTDPGGSDDDGAVFIIPNVIGFHHGAAGNYRVFPAWNLGVDPVKFDVAFGASAVTVKADVAIPASPLLVVRIGVWG